MMKKLLIISLLGATSLFGAEKASFGLNINSDDLEVEGRVSMATRTRSLEYRNFFFDGNFIKGDEDNLYGVGFYVENSPLGYPNLKFGIGLRSIFSGNDKLDKDFVAIPVQVSAKARMYLGNLPKSNLGVRFAYAPSPLTFSDADSYLEYRIEADMQIIQNIDIYIGYRNIETNYDNADVDFNSAGYIGFKFLF
jgi:hypothetical protein